MTVSSWCFRVLTGADFVFVCVYALDGDGLSCDCSFLSRALLIGFIEEIYGGNRKTWQMALNQMSHFISPLKIFSTDAMQRPEKCYIRS